MKDLPLVNGKGGCRIPKALEECVAAKYANVDMSNNGPFPGCE